MNKTNKNGWKYKKLGDENYFELIMGQSPPSKTYNLKKNGLPFFQGKAEFGKMFPTPKKYCSEPTRIAEKDDVLISVRAPVGPTNLANERCCIGRGLAAIRCKQDIIPRFLLYALRAIEGDIANSVCDQGGGFTAIKKSQLKAVKIPVPPLEEQRRIVARIEELIRRAEEARRLRQEAIAKTSSQFFHVRRKIFESLILDCPTKPLGECGQVIGGGTPSKKRHDYWNEHIPWISAKEMKGFELIDSELKITDKGLSESSAKLIPKNSVLFVVRGSILYHYVPVAVNKMPCTINQDLKAIVPNDDINPTFLAHMLWGANDLLQEMVETAGNTAGKLPTPNWSAFKVPIPDLEKQLTIVQELQSYQEKLDELISLQSKVSNVMELFQSALLAKAFRGEL